MITIPKGSAVVPLLESANHDPNELKVQRVPLWYRQERLPVVLGGQA